MKVDGQMVDGYYFCVDGAVGKHQALTRATGYRCPATEVPVAIEQLLRRYLATRFLGENLRQFFTRHSDAELRALLAGEEVEAVARDPSPHGVEGRHWEETNSKSNKILMARLDGQGGRLEKGL